MGKIIHKHKDIWKDKNFILSVIIGAIFLFVSFVANYYAGIYATSQMSNAVTDILLSRFHEINSHFVIIDGIPIFIGILAILSILEPKRIPFIMKSMALFVVIRAGFLVMTHYAPYPDREIFQLNALTSRFFVGGELFFSGHTGMPFLMALAFWNDKKLRYLFLFFTLAAAVSVILGHVHYTIDVFAAPFITYSIYVISKRFFANDYKIFMETIKSSKSN